MNQVQKVHKQQQTRHLVANKLTAALTALRHLRDGGLVGQKLIERAIHDLEAVMAWVDRKGRRIKKP